jgi:hypothetical protein
VGKYIIAAGAEAALAPDVELTVIGSINVWKAVKSSFSANVNMKGQSR